MFTNKLKLKENVAPIHNAYYSAMKSHHGNYEIMSLVATRMDLGGSQSQPERGRQNNMISLAGKLLKIYKGTHLIHKKIP